MSPSRAMPPHVRAQLLALQERYARPSWQRSTWQLVSTLLPHFALNFLLYRIWQGPLWLTVVLLYVNGLFLSRLFVLFHDLMHGSLFSSRRLNETLGTLLSLLIFMPAQHWQYEHNYHHAGANDLSRRGYGDMPLLTVREYRALSPWRRFRYRLLRHPAFLFTFHAVYKLVFFPRVAANRAWPRRVHLSVWFTNLAIAVAGLGLWAMGLERVFWIQVLSFVLSAPGTVFLFYINHHFEQAQWQPPSNWSFVDAALKGTSILLYPPVLKWFSAGIGLHSMHHLATRIPNYRLERCWKESALFQQATVIPMSRSFRAMKLRLWDEESGRYVGREGYRLQGMGVA
jgi:omega-6 fatty acid desaturase (delta-12 desaturase)